MYTGSSTLYYNTCPTSLFGKLTIGIWHALDTVYETHLCLSARAILWKRYGKVGRVEVKYELHVDCQN